MSFSEAVSEMLQFLDDAVGDLPAPVGNVNNMPKDVVVLRSVERQNNGIGKITEEDPVNNRIIEQGQFSAVVDAQLWSSKNKNIVQRSRILITDVFNMSQANTDHGVFKKLNLAQTSGPKLYEKGKLWKITITINLTFEYRFEEVPGTGIINQVPVSLEGEMDEEFVVS